MPSHPNPRQAVIELLERRQLLAVNVSINTNTRYQQMDGFGTALAWWMNTPYSPDAFRNMYYQDLGSSMLRVDVNINSLAGPDDDITTPVTLVDNLQTNISQFNFSAQGVANFGGVANASLTKSLDTFKLIGSLWTPPHWMKGPELDAGTGQPNGNQPSIVNGTDSSGGSLVDTPANLQQFGRYVAAYVKGFEQTYGVPFYAISIQNELAFHEPFNSCVYPPALYIKALKAVSDAFDHYGITCKIQGPEDVGVGSTANLPILQRTFKYIDAVRADPIAMADLDIYSIHGYATETATPNRSPEMWKEYWTGRPSGQFPSPNWTGISGDGKKSWQTENSGGTSHVWSNGQRIVNNILDAVTQSNVSAWLYWQTVDGSPAGAGNLTSGTDSADPKYVGAKHFFRYVRPGSYRVAATPSDPNGVYVSAFIHDQQHTVTVVVSNTTTAAQTVNITSPQTTLTSFNIARESDGTQVWANLGPVNFVSGVASVTLPASSAITLQGTFTGGDTTPPTVTDSAFEYESNQRLRFAFSESVSASLGTGDLTLQNLTNPGATFSVNGVTWDAATNTARFSFNPAILPDGNYRATLSGAGVTDTAGNPLGTNFVKTFFFLNGDANRDSSVGSTDFNTLASNFGKTGKVFSQGNFNYDAAGNVDSADFNILASQFGKSLPGLPAARGTGDGAGAPGGMGGSSGSSLFGGGQIGGGHFGDDDSDAPMA